MEDVFGSWMLISFLAPAFWAMANIIDVYFVDGIYNDELDGTIISGLFQMAPWPFLFFYLDTDFPAIVTGVQTGSFAVDWTLVNAVLGGFLFSSAFYFYFKSLFNHNDVSLVQIIWNLCVVVVPIMSYFLVGETLSVFQYIGMAITLTGAMLMGYHPGIRLRSTSKFILPMTGAVIFLSLSMTLENSVYTELAKISKEQDAFWIGFLYFSVGGFCGGSFLALASRRNPFHLIKKYYRVFIFAEAVAFFGNLASQKALSMASPGLVATIETFVPVFIVGYSLIIVSCSFFLKKNREAAQRVYNEQLTGGWLKLIATIVMALGVYIIG